MLERSNIKKIIIVDDSQITHSIYKVFLSMHGDIDVIHCSNGLEAWEALKKEQDIKLVLLDLEMPVMDGFELLEKKSSDAGMNDIPVVVISWNDSHEGMQRAMELGAYRFINKSGLSELGQCIRELL